MPDQTLKSLEHRRRHYRHQQPALRIAGRLDFDLRQRSGQTREQVGE